MRRLPAPSDPTKTTIVTKNYLNSKTDKVVRLIAQEVDDHFNSLEIAFKYLVERINLFERSFKCFV